MRLLFLKLRFRLQTLVSTWPLGREGFSVGVVRQAEMAWWFLFDCLKKDSLKTMARHAGSPSKAFRVLKDQFLPLSQSDSCTRGETEVTAHAFERESRNLLCIHERDAWCSTNA